MKGITDSGRTDWVVLEAQEGCLALAAFEVPEEKQLLTFTITSV
jgi:hypothetical protein